MGQLSSDITTTGLLHVLGGGVYSRCQCRVHGRDAEADDGVDQTEDKYSHECCQCIFAVLREEVEWHGEILLPPFLSFSLLSPLSFPLFFLCCQQCRRQAKGLWLKGSLVEGSQKCSKVTVTMAVPGPGKDVFVLKVKFRPQSACRTAVVGLPGRDRGSVRQPANRSDGPTHPNPVHPAQQGVTREWWDVIGPSLIDWIIESSPNVRTWPRLSRPSIFIVTNTRPEFNPPPGQHPRQSSLVPQNSYPTPLDSTALRTWTCSHILHTRQSKEEPP